MPDAGINVGDAVLTFFGDTTKLDQSFAKVQTTAAVTSTNINMGFEKVGVKAVEAAAAVDGVGEAIREVSPVSPEVPASFERVRFSAYEAKGEVKLLGEAVGVHMPRHVASFVTTLPGVGAALSAAFSITAVGFLLSALVQVAEKLSAFSAEFLYHATAAKASDDAIAALNKTLNDLKEKYQEAKDKADAYGKSALQLATESKEKVEKSVADLTAALVKQDVEIAHLTEQSLRHTYVTSSISEAYAKWDKSLYGLGQAFLSVTIGLDQYDKNQQRLNEAMAKHLTLVAQLKVANQDHRNVVHGVTEEQKKLNEEYDKADAAYSKAKNAIARLNVEMQRHADITAAIAEVDEAKLPKMTQQWLELGKALTALGLNTVDLEKKQQDEAHALDLVQAAEQRGAVSHKTYLMALLHEQEAELALKKARDEDTKSLEKNIASIQKSLGIDKQKEKSYEKLTQLDKIFQQERLKTGSVEKAVWATTAEAMGSAVAAYAMGAATIEQSLAKMLQAELASISQRATVRAIEEIAEGLAAMFTDPPKSASHFASAAEFALLGAATAVAGSALGGATGAPGTAAGNPITTGSGITSSATQPGAMPVQTTGIQHFAEGALVSEPTLALMGEGRKREGVLPLDDPQAMKKIAAAISEHMLEGGPTQRGGVQVHVQGLISPDNLNRVVKRINRMVNNRETHLLSSNSMRLTRRSQ